MTTDTTAPPPPDKEELRNIAKCWQDMVQKEGNFPSLPKHGDGDNGKYIGLIR